MELQTGTRIERYEVLGFFGEGAMARVFKVRHSELGATYALKVLRVGHPGVRARLLREGQVQASLRHRNIVSVTDVVSVDGQPGLVMEFIAGGDLDEHIQTRHPLCLDEITDIGTGLIHGVRAAHRAGHLHRDLKPANVLMVEEDDEWIPKIADFGLAKVLHESTGGIASTRTGSLMGSPAYMSPEQARDSKNVDERTDVFSLGCILYELATDVRAFDGPDVVSTLTRIAAGTYAPVGELRPDLPPHQAMAITGALVTDLDDRIPDCDTLLAVWKGMRSFEVEAHSPKDTLAQLIGPTIDVDGGESIAPELDGRPPSESLGSSRSSTTLGAPSNQTRGGIVALMAGVGGVGLGAGAVLVLGVVGLGGWWFGRGEESLVEPLQMSITEVATAEPAALPVILREPHADVVRTAPGSAVSETSKPAGSPAPASYADPTPPSPQVVRPMGTVSLVEGSAVEEVWLTRNGSRFQLGQVAPGTYFVVARFDGQDAPRQVKGVVLTVRRDRTTQLYCDGFGWRCVER